MEVLVIERGLYFEWKYDRGLQSGYSCRNGKFQSNLVSHRETLYSLRATCQLLFLFFLFQSKKMIPTTGTMLRQHSKTLSRLLRFRHSLKPTNPLHTGIMRRPPRQWIIKTDHLLHHLPPGLEVDHPIPRQNHQMPHNAFVPEHPYRPRHSHRKMGPTHRHTHLALLPVLALQPHRGKWINNIYIFQVLGQPTKR